MQTIFDKYVNEDWSITQISKFLNQTQKRVPRQKNDNDRFTEVFVRKILDNETYHGFITYGRTKTKMAKDSEGHKKPQRVKSDEYIVTRGTHTPIISEEIWDLAHQKRLTEMKCRKKENRRTTDYVYPLTGLIVCPDCGTRLTGFVEGQKRNKKGEPYPRMRSYRCPKAKQQKGVACHFFRQLGEKQMLELVLNVIDKIVHNHQFMTMVSDQIGAAVDVSTLESELEDVRKKARKSERVVERLGNEMDALDDLQPTYDLEYEDLRARRSSALRDAVYWRDQAETISMKIATAKANRLSRDSVFQILLQFDSIFSKMTDDEKKRCLHAMIDRIEIREDLMESKGTRIDYSSVIRSIKFRFPLDIKEVDISGLSLTVDDSDETVVLLVKLPPDDVIKVKLDVSELPVSIHDGDATYPEIKAYVEKQFGLKVSSLYISQVKRKHGLPVTEAYNKPKSETARQPQCPPEKEKAITEALRYFKMIP